MVVVPGARRRFRRAGQARADDLRRAAGRDRGVRRRRGQGADLRRRRLCRSDAGTLHRELKDASEDLQDAKDEPARKVAERAIATAEAMIAAAG